MSKKRISLRFGYKLLLFFIALIIAGLSLFYTNNLIEKIKNQEKIRLIMKSENKPLEIKLTSKHSNFIYYRDSFLLLKLQNYPFFQVFLVLLFVFVAYFLLLISKKADDNRIWIGMSKETAHQLGTPISSLLAWVEMMKIKQPDDPMLAEVQKDVNRLEMITERFARIGSKPKLIQEDLISTVKKSIEYIKLRTSDKVEYNLEYNVESFNINLNSSLFQWIIENLAKNSIDAMSGKGKIFINIDVQKNV